MDRTLVVAILALVLLAGGATAFARTRPPEISPAEKAERLAELDAQIAAITANTKASNPMNVLKKNLDYARLDQTASIRAFCVDQYLSSSGRKSCEAKQKRVLIAVADIYQDTVDHARVGMARELNKCTAQNTLRGFVDWAGVSDCVIVFLQAAIEADRRSKL